MNGKELLAVVGVGAALSAGLGVEIAAHERTTSRAAAITIRACQRAYMNEGSVNKKFLACVREGWVPEGRSLHPELGEGDPAELVDGYAEIAESKGRHFNIANPALFGLIGAVGSFAFGILAEGREIDERRRTAAQKETKESSASSEPDPIAEETDQAAETIEVSDQGNKA
jgi:hypothetical protein